MKFFFPVVLFLSSSTTSLGQSLKATAAAARSIKDAAGAGNFTEIAMRASRGNAPDWKTNYDEYVKYVDPDDLGFVIKLNSEGTRHTERGEDYGFMCRGKKCEEDDWLVTNHVRCIILVLNEFFFYLVFGLHLLTNIILACAYSLLYTDQQQRGKVSLRIRPTCLPCGFWTDQSQNERSLLRSR